MKRAHPAEPHWYLAAIGSDPTVRGQGFGQVLMRSRLQRCDAECCPAYLESSKPENVPYYERFGFTVVGDAVSVTVGCAVGAGVVWAGGTEATCFLQPPTIATTPTKDSDKTIAAFRKLPLCITKPP